MRYKSCTGETTHGTQTPNGGVNKSAAIRDVYKHNPEMKVKEVVATLSGRGIEVAPNLVYLIKGKTKGEKNRRRLIHRNAATVATASGNADAVKTIIKVKTLASEVGGLDTLKR